MNQNEPTTVAREREIPAQVTQLGRAVGEILGLAVELRDQLSPYMKPAPPGQEESDKNPLFTQFGGDLEAIIIQARTSRDLLSDAIGRLEL